MNQANTNIKQKAQPRRIPRPLGITARIQSASKNKETYQDELKLIQKSIVETWTSAGMRLNDRTVTMEQLKNFTGLTDKAIDKYMWGAMNKMGKVMERKEIGQIAREVFGMAFKKSLEIGAQIQDQVAILSARQGSQYVPFLTSALNQALANLNQSQTPLHNLLRMLTDKADVNILNYTNINNNGASTVFLNHEAAMKLIQENQQSMLEDPHLATAQIEKYKSAGLLPDINARTQNVAELTKPKIFLNPALTKADPIKHENRREAEVGPIRIEDAEEFTA